jgi:hypothetical protein
MLEISLVAAQFVASQEGLSSVCVCEVMYLTIFADAKSDHTVRLIITGCVLQIHFNSFR